MSTLNNFKKGLLTILSLLIFIILNAQIDTQNFDSETPNNGTITCATAFTFTGTWKNSPTTDNKYWVARSSSTSSISTGPTSDYTGGNYVYIEASSCYNKTANLVSPVYDFSSNSAVLLEFYYHMYGSGMGSLSVEVSSDGGTLWDPAIWTLSGDQGNSWQFASVNLSAYAGLSNVIIRFRGVTGLSYTSDISLDAILLYEPLPMTYLSSTTTQLNTTNVLIGSTNQEIIGIEVVTSGALTSFDITQFQINMTGTTNISDVSNIDIYSTGTNPSFATTILFGSVTPALGTINVNGIKALSDGTNYFWLVYDISASATGNNYLDAQCTQISMNGSIGDKIPTQIAPIGNRLIEPPMSFSSCAITQTNTSDVWPGTINNVVIGIELVTTGSVQPIDVTQFNFSTNGSSNPSVDITNAKLWATGTNSLFATTNQIGSDVILPNGNFNITGTYTLNTGTNYFWLCYDISSGAQVADVVDAECSSIVVDGVTQTLSVQSVTGERQIADGCMHTLILYDSGGDGWQSGALDLFVNGLSVFSGISVPASPGDSIVYYFSAFDGDNITTIFTPGTSSSQCSYIIFNRNNAFLVADGLSGSPTGIATLGDCSSSPQFFINGNAYQTGKDCYTLTDASNNQTGLLWNNYRVDLDQDLYIEYSAYFGNNDAGADGMAFGFQNSCLSAGSLGGGIGYSGISPSVMVEFDTYSNNWPSHITDTIEDHIIITRNGVTTHSIGNSLTRPVVINSNIENNAWHNVKINWNATTKTLSVDFDNGATTLSYTGDIVTNIFGGNSNVYWGFTASTGGAYNSQKICMITYPTATFELQDTTICTGSSIQINAGLGSSSYTWSPDNGTISNVNIANPVFSPIITSTYYLKVVDDCGNVTNSDMIITIDPCTLPIDLMYFNAESKDEQKVLLKWQTLTESNNDYFIIQRSTDGINFENLFSEKGAGNSNIELNYEVIDNNPQVGINYYRLKQVDFDGSYTFSEVRTININQVATTKVYPNPCADEISFVITSQKQSSASIIIFDMLSRLIYEYSNYEIIEGTNIFKYDTSKLNPGNYLLKITTDNGKFYDCIYFMKE